MAISGQGFFSVSEQAVSPPPTRRRSPARATTAAPATLPGQRRLPGQQRGRVPQRLPGQPGYQRRQHQPAGADPGDADAVFAGRHLHQGAGRQRVRAAHGRQQSRVGDGRLRRRRRLARAADDLGADFAQQLDSDAVLAGQHRRRKHHHRYGRCDVSTRTARWPR